VVAACGALRFPAAALDQVAEVCGPWRSTSSASGGPRARLEAGERAGWSRPCRGGGDPQPGAGAPAGRGPCGAAPPELEACVLTNRCDLRPSPPPIDSLVRLPLLLTGPVLTVVGSSPAGARPHLRRRWPLVVEEWRRWRGVPGADCRAAAMRLLEGALQATVATLVGFRWCRFSSPTCWPGSGRPMARSALRFGVVDAPRSAEAATERSPTWAGCGVLSFLLASHDLRVRHELLALLLAPHVATSA